MPMSHRNMDPLQNFDMPSSGGANNRENKKRYSNRYNRRSSNKNWRNNNSAYKKKNLINQHKQAGFCWSPPSVFFLRRPL